MPRPPSSNRGNFDPVSQVMNQHSALHYPDNAGTILGAEIQAEATMAGSKSENTSQGWISIPASIRAIDTNVLVRLIVRDTPDQVERGEAFVARGV